MNGPTQELSAPMRSTHMPALDGVRGVAVLVVMILHFTILNPANGAEHLFYLGASFGWAGVDLFFVLSGFLITGILIDAKSGDAYFRTFYMRRALRIFPLYYAFLIFIFWIWPLLSPSTPEPLGPRLWTLGYMGNFLFAFNGWEGVPGHTTHLWSLAIEEQFYFIWPLVVFLAGRRTLVKICLWAIALAWFTRLGFHLGLGHGVAGYALLPARMDALALGALLSVMVRSPGWVETLRANLPRMAWGGLALLVLTCSLTPFLAPGDGLLPPLQLHVQLLGYPAVDLLSLALVGYAILPGVHKEGSLLMNSTLRRLGKYSYALYLLHIPLRNVLIDRVFPGGDLPVLLGSQIPAQLLLIVGSILVTYVVALLSWNLFERHFLTLKRHFEYRKPEPPTPAGLQPAA
jgi:peptidoglycan/LPS O-acetylase OafA/YrhL